MKPGLLLAVTLGLAVSGCGGSPSREGGGGFGEGHATVRLIGDTQAFAPGRTHTLGVTFDIEPDWHLYWDGLNDTGFPITVELALPAGFSADAMQWPAPERHITPGNILDHVYRDQVTLLVPVHVPEDARQGVRATVRAKVQWLACREVCVPGSGETAISLLIADPESDLWKAADEPGSADSKRRIEEARRRLPGPPEGDAVRWHWADGKLVVEADRAGYLAFFPFSSSMVPQHLIEDGESESGSLSLGFDEEPGDATTVEGVVEVRTGGSKRFFTLHAPFPENG